MFVNKISSKISNKLSDIISNKRFLFIFFITCIFLASTFYVYIYYIKPRLNPTFIENREFLDKNKDNSETATLYFFYAKWCPHSKKALPEIKKFQETNKQYENTIINYKYINEEDDVKDITEFENKYDKKIDGYPTILLVYKNQVVEFDTEIKQQNLVDFFNTVF